jgi:hypothetical protein
MSVLALSDGATFAMWAVNLLCTVGLGIVLANVARGQSKLQRAEDKREQDVNALKGNLHSMAEKLIDERFRHMTHDVRNHVQSFTLTLDKMTARMNEADKQFASIGGIGPIQEARLANAMSDLKDQVRELIDNRCERTDKKIDDLTRVVVTDDDLRRLREEFRNHG